MSLRFGPSGVPLSTPRPGTVHGIRRARELGAALSRLHVHVSGIEYGPGGERRRVPLLQSKFRWRDLLRALREVRASGWVICETPAMEEDALPLQRYYRRIA